MFVMIVVKNQRAIRLLGAVGCHAGDGFAGAGVVNLDVIDS
jgi:hypothetical protein